MVGSVLHFLPTRVGREGEGGLSVWKLHIHEFGGLQAPPFRGHSRVVSVPQQGLLTLSVNSWETLDRPCPSPPRGVFAKGYGPRKCLRKDCGVYSKDWFKGVLEKWSRWRDGVGQGKD